jgi:hypothetical protein
MTTASFLPFHANRGFCLAYRGLMPTVVKITSSQQMIVIEIIKKRAMNS